MEDEAYSSRAFRSFRGMAFTGAVMRRFRLKLTWEGRRHWAIIPMLFDVSVTRCE